MLPMRRVSLTIFVCLAYSFLFAQRKDSLYVIVKDDAWVLPHKVLKEETVFSISKDYHVPPAKFADVNNVNYQTNLKEGSTVYIPLGGYNKATLSNGAKPFYYKVRSDDNLFHISQLAGVKQHVLQEWNNLPDNTIEPGQKLLAGWVFYKDQNVKEKQTDIVSKIKTAKGTIAKGVTKLADGTLLIPLSKDTVVDTTSIEEKNYNVQTNHGVNAAAESGTVVFFDMPGKKKSDKKYYAFHNLAHRGVYIKVHNPGTDKTIFVKVIGLMPTTRQYANAIIGISSNAKEALGVNDVKAWCELSYGL
jgi:LysM repeat protein